MKLKSITPSATPLPSISASPVMIASFKPDLFRVMRTAYQQAYQQKIFFTEQDLKDRRLYRVTDDFLLTLLRHQLGID